MLRGERPDGDAGAAGHDDYEVEVLLRAEDWQIEMSHPSSGGFARHHVCAADAEKAASGATLASLPGDKAIELTLKPAADVAFPVKPTRTPKAEDVKTFGGFVNIETAEAAHVQVTLSAHAWIDVAQNGKTLEATGHTGSHDCAAIRKSVRFETGSGPLSLQISGAKKETIRIAIRPASD